jgi:hypothetical protein
MQGSEREMDALEGGDGEVWDEIPGELGVQSETFESDEGFEAPQSQQRVNRQRR